MYIPSWQLPDDGLQIQTLDAHTGGEPLRIITGGLPKIPGKNVLEKRRYFREHLDYIRTALMWEPRGHADMYGAVLTEPHSQEADFGVFFIHNEGYSTMCGHAVIALATALLEVGILEKPGENPEIRMDTPAGLVSATAFRKNGRVHKVAFRNVPSFVYAIDQTVEVPGIGRISYDIAYGGAFYVYCDAHALGIDLTESHYGQLIDWGRRIKYAVREQVEIHHPFEEDLSFLYGTIFVGTAHDSNHHSRNVCIFANGEVDRSPTGTGVSGRIALHITRKEIDLYQSLTIESILGSLMEVEAVERLNYGDYDAVIPRVSGSAHITGTHTFYIDPNDPLQKGFIFR